MIVVLEKTVMWMKMMFVMLCDEDDDEDGFFLYIPFQPSNVCRTCNMSMTTSSNRFK